MAWNLAEIRTVLQGGKLVQVGTPGV